MDQTLDTSGIDVRRIAVETMFWHGLGASDVARDRLELAKHGRDGRAVALWSAVAKEIDRRTQPLPRFCH